MKVANGKRARPDPVCAVPATENIYPPGEARSGDAIVVMGARDPSLTAFCRAALGAVKKKKGE